MEVFVDRDAVGPGDDDAPHGRRVTLPDDLAIEAVVERLVADGFLPRVEGPAAWSASSGVPIAVYAQGWPRPRPVSWRGVDGARLRRRDGVVGIHFSYHARQDPEAVLETLRRLRLDPFAP